MGWGDVFRNVLYILLPQKQAYDLAESADSIAIPIHCVASGTQSFLRDCDL